MASSPGKLAIASKPWFLATVLVIAVFAAYQPVWHAGFIWDDDDHLTANPAMTAPNGLRMIWSSLIVSRYYPLTLTTFWVEHRFWGLNPLPYHLVNIGLHALNGFLIFLVLRRLCIPGAWLVAMLWAVHPVNVESVAWITELKNTQSGFFFFLSLLCFLRSEADKKARWYVLALVCGLGAMLSKPSAVVLPVVMLLCVWWQRGCWRRADMLRIAPFLGLALGMSALTIIEQRGHVLRAGTVEWRLGMAERLVIAGKAVWFYAGKVLWPARLAFVYPRWDVNVSAVWSWAPLAGLVVVGVILRRCGRERPCRAVLFACGYFVGALLPVLGFVDVFYFRYSFVADHFQYLASVGLIALVAGEGMGICKRLGQRGRSIGVVAAAALLAVLGTLTWRQGHIYRDLETLWRDTAAKNPQSWLAHNHLANQLFKQGQLTEAVAEGRIALRVGPGVPETHSTIGLILFDAGETDEAIAQLEEGVRLRPHSAVFLCNLGYCLLRLGRFQEAALVYERALQIRQNDADAYANLGYARVKMGETTEAIEQYQHALRIDPDNADVHYNLGNALVRIAKLSQAVEQYEQALRLKPENAGAHYNLADTLLRLGKPVEALPHYQQASQIAPDSAAFHSKLGAVLIVAGKPQEAIAHLEHALRIKPEMVEAQNNLAWLLATLPPAQGGDPTRAVSLAQRACALTGDQSASYLDTLGVAYAAAGRFNEAIATAQKAIELARSTGQTQLVSQIDGRLTLYRAGHGYHDEAMGS